MNHVALVQGSSRDWSADVESTLKVRLRMASAILLIGFAVFLVRNLLATDTATSIDQITLVAHVALTVVLALATVDLCRNCSKSNRWLRIKELVIFGLPGLYFLWIQWHDTLQCASHGFLVSPDATWLILMFTYALFIPNPWPRAAVVIGSMAVAPIALMAVLLGSQSICREAWNAQPGFLSSVILTLVVGGVAAIAGVRAIGVLRREAFWGRQLGQYRLRELLGAGGMGEVYLADHQFMKRPCAIKVIRAERAGDPQVIARFEREVQATARLSHWNSIDIYDYGQDEAGTFYYVMEYLPGMSLQNLVDQFGPMTPARAIHLLVQVCDALEEAHQIGLYHRDIKPANIFAAERGGLRDVAKILDFGLAKCARTSSKLDMTQEGSFHGSPLYMPPEQADGDVEVDGRGDIYALGGVAFFLLTGRPPFDVQRPVQALIAHAKDAPVRPSSLGPEIPRRLDQIVLKCLAKSPDDRYETVCALREDLLQAQAELPHVWTRADAEHWWQTRYATDVSREAQHDVAAV